MKLVLESFDSNAYKQYLEQHIGGVQRAYQLLIENAIVEQTPELDLQIKLHDRSKYGKEEFDAYGEAFYGSKKKHAEDIDFKYAWLHHQHNNPHHWQHWCLKEDDGGNLEALPMPENYIIEMICDWWSFSINKGNYQEIQEWYKKEKKNQIMHPDTVKRVEELLTAIKDITE